MAKLVTATAVQILRFAGPGTGGSNPPPLTHSNSPMKNLLFLLLLTSCVTPKKAVDVLSRPKNEPVAAEFCAAKYPVRDSIIRGDSVIRFDTLWETYTDTLISEPQVITETRIVPKTVTKWITRTDTIIRENTAKVSVLNSQIAKLFDLNRNLSEKNTELTQQRDEYKSQRNKARLINWILYVVIGLSIGFLVRKKFKLF